MVCVAGLNFESHYDMDIVFQNLVQSPMDAIARH